MIDPMELSASELAAAIRAGEISPREAVEAALAHIEARAALNAFVTLRAEAARNEAMDAAARLTRGDEPPPLLGVPFAATDLLSTAGVRTTMGSRLDAASVPDEDAVAVARMKSAGAILIGKTTTAEFGHKPFADSALSGRTLNPWNERFTAGPNGGAAVAVSAGMAALALGAGTGGAIGVAAACCGVVGLKPTRGAVPDLDNPDLFGSTSAVGPIGRSVADINLAFLALRGGSRWDPNGQIRIPERRPRGLAGLRTAWLPRCGSAVIERDVAAACFAAVERLTGLGVIVQEVTLDLAPLGPDFLVMAESALAAQFGADADAGPDLLDPTLLACIERGRRHSAVALQRAQLARSALFRSLQELFDRVDLLISPTLTAPALQVGLDPHGTIRIADREVGSLFGGWCPFAFPSISPAIRPSACRAASAALACRLACRSLPAGTMNRRSWRPRRRWKRSCRGWLRQRLDAIGVTVQTLA